MFDAAQAATETISEPFRNHSLTVILLFYALLHGGAVVTSPLRHALRDGQGGAVQPPGAGHVSFS
jgi:hypothetical protein